MSYKQDLRAAELAVIETATVVVASAALGWSNQENLTVKGDDLRQLDTDLTALFALREQLDAPTVPYSDDDTSANAARLALPMVAGLRRRIIFAVAGHERYPLPGVTDDQLERKLGRSHQTVSAARRSLVEMGWLRDGGSRATTRTGRMAVMWVLTGFGKDSVVKLALDQAKVVLDVPAES